MQEDNQSSSYQTELEKNGVIAFVPSGNSMWPTLKNHKQSVFVKKKEQKLKKYDVALYMRSNGIYVLHRVMMPTDYGYIICGDSQFSLEKVKEEQVFGVMTEFYKGKKLISADDEKYKRKVENWYKHKKIRKIRLKLFYIRVKIKSILHRIFCGKTKTDKE